jgi:hypothetical protein
MGKDGSGCGREGDCNAESHRGIPAVLASGATRSPRVSGMQAKLHRWAAADRGRRFDDLFNLVHDPATLLVAFGRVAGNRAPALLASTA